MSLSSYEVFGVAESEEGVSFAIRAQDIVYPFLVTREALQDAARKNGDDPNVNLLEIWQIQYDRIIAIAVRTFDLAQAVERYEIETDELNSD